MQFLSMTQANQFTNSDVETAQQHALVRLQDTEHHEDFDNHEILSKQSTGTA